MLFSHEDWVRVHIKMTLLGIELGTLEVKGEWSDHYTTEAPIWWNLPASTKHKTAIRVKSTSKRFPIYSIKLILSESYL